MTRLALFVLWAVLAWIAPAAVAGAFGWSSIWGSGSGALELLIPIPMGTGVLHIPSFALVSLILVTQPWPGRLAGCARGVLVAGALVGVVALLDLGALHVAATTDATLQRIPWEQNPLGLCVLTDFLLAQLFLGAFRGRGPVGGPEWLACLALAIAVPALYAASSLQADPRQRSPFIETGARGGPGRTDESVFIYSKRPIGTDAFRESVRALIKDHDPRRSVNTEDVALLFFDSLDAARSRRVGEAKQTLCLYEDGTPMAWHSGGVDCFADHESFGDRMQKALAAQDRMLPVDVQVYLARRTACAGRAPLVMEPGVHDDNDETRMCTRPGVGREDLLARHGSDPRVAALLAAP